MHHYELQPLCQPCLSQREQQQKEALEAVRGVRSVLLPIFGIAFIGVAAAFYFILFS